MELNEYQQNAKLSAIYPKKMGIEYTTLGLVGEAGEVANKIKKQIRDGVDSDVTSEDIALELGDVLWYLALLADEYGFTLEEIASMNFTKVKQRYGG